ncbi:MAG: CRTAC1 family protein [Phycisphaerales bacterium]|nr:CRTAC1 family protein [Phycisphaerae bacterium]NNF43949.1 CRTAC1 family protein [Phycisphaerales bacterium]NNM26872.1 CRTAC1 family protein [Phycisphaerales bacterium]
MTHRRSIVVAAGVIGVGLHGCAPPTPGEPAANDPPSSSAWFQEDALARGLQFTYRSGAGVALLFPEIVGGGVALFDLEGDGDLDVYCVQGGGVLTTPAERPPNQLFRNRGDGTFDDVTLGSGAGDRGYGMGVATGDVDGDGLVDLYVTNLGPNTLLRNRGDGTFEDITGVSGLGDEGWGTSAAFLDYDRDGDQDLFVVNYIHWSPATERDCFAATGERDYCAPDAYAAPAVDRLYRNDGHARFTDVTEAAGVHAAFGNGLGVVTGDFTGDAWPDVFVANDGMANQLWVNRTDGTFVDAAPVLGVALDDDGLAKAGMGTCAEDFDDDGDLDLLVVNLEHETDSLYRNEDGRYFVDDTARAGLGPASRRHTRFGVGLYDFDHDGHLDLFAANGRVRRRAGATDIDPFAEPDRLMRGLDGARFAAVPGGAGGLRATSRGAAFGDLDGDGGVDVVVVNRDAAMHVRLNRAPGRAGWIRFRLLDGPRDALGATVWATVGDRTVRREVRTASSYCAANDPRVHIGLGPTSGVTDVRVRWSDGSREHFGAHAAGREWTLRRGDGHPE